MRTQPNHPRADEQYYKIQIGPLERLPRPIPSRKWRRITFLYTTGEHLLAAEELNDLIVQSAERELLWKALRERQNETRGGGEVDLALLCALGTLGITLGEAGAERRGWRYLSFSETAIKAELPSVVQAIEQEVERLGGLAA